MPAFICNGMLGKLCTLMRMCGIDTMYSNQGTMIIITARKENRIILTRNTKFKGKPGVFFPASSNPFDQLLIVIREFNLRKDIRLFTRCLECNAILHRIAKKKVKDRVPYYTFRHFFEFSECPHCHKIYWKGSHYKKMTGDISLVLDRIDALINGDNS